MKKALFILHQKTSEAGDLGNKLKKRNFIFYIRRPTLGEKLPTNLKDYNLIVVFGGPMSANDNNEFIRLKVNYLNMEEKGVFLYQKYHVKKQKKLIKTERGK